MKKDLVPVELDEEIRVLKTGGCLSLSGRSDLTYEVGCMTDKSILIRLTENTGSGMFSKAWIPVAQIAQLLSADNKPITAKTIRPLYSGSVNSVGFLQAVLKDVGLIKNMEENSRGYVRADPKKFTDEIKDLMENKSPPHKKPTKDKKANKTKMGEES